MQFIIRRWTGLLCVMTATTAIAIMPNKTLPLPNYDRRAEKASHAPAVAEQAHNAATAKLAARVSRLKVTRDEITGTPKLISSADGFLTGHKAQGRGVSAQALRGLEEDPHRSVKAFLNEHSALFGQDASLLSNARIKREFVTPHNGMRTVIWEQQLDGLPVFEGLLTGHITKNEELVNLSSRFIPNSAQAANAGSGKPAADRAKPRIDAPAAIVRAAADVDVTVSTNEIAARYEAQEERPNVLHYAAPELNGSTEANLVWLPLDGRKLRLCWQIILTSRKRGEMYRVLVDAEDGTPLLRHCLTSYISEATYRVYTSDSPSPFSPCHPTPLTNQPPLASRVLVTTMALNTNASPSGWINDGVNETRGNNVDAHLDRDANDSPDLPRPQGSPNRVFDFPMNLAQAPGSYTNASVTQLFYWNNWMHDKLYELGFTEAAGNFQVNNFGRGGVGNDAVNADAQDGAGFNNANFSTPPDGSPGRMQMFLFDAPSPDRDGDFDAEVVLHEYGHGLSNRRVGGGVGISTLQSAGMGEGWSDFYGLALLSESGDDIHATYAAGGYLTFQLAGLLENYYFGIRRYPYSTDLSKNPLTFKDIDPGQASGHVGVPISPIFGGSPANEVHNQGEVWCVTLWDARANLIEKHGYEIGNRLILQLVTDGMNLSPANPNFLESRDAILEADRVLTGGANFTELWRAFARRGMGFSATSPASTTTTGVRESFDVPDDLLVLPTGSLLMIGPVGGPFTPAAQTYSLTNVSTNNVIWSAMNSQTWLQLSNTSGSLGPGALVTTVTASLNSAAELLPLGVHTDQITFTNHVSGRTQSRSVTLAVGQPDHFTEQFEGDNDLDFLMLTFTPDGSASHYSLCRETVSALPIDPRDGKAIALSDDTFTTVQLVGSARVTLYGKSTNVFFIGSNGYITFDFGDSTLSDSLTSHFALPRIAALMTDLNPAAGGSVSWQQAGDRAVLTFLNVPLYGTINNTNTFQIEMFYDGRIRITYLRVDSTFGLAGLSRGEGLPPAFRESDFNAYPTCSARFLVSFLSTVTEGQGVVEGTVSLPVAATSNVVALLRSSNPAELTLPETVKIGTGETSAPFSATIVDDTRLDGSQRVTITASKPGYTSHNAVTTVHDNEQTGLTLTLPSGLVEGAASGQGLVAAAQAVDAPVTVFLSVSDPSVQLPVAVTIPTGSDSAVFAIAALNNLQIDGNRLTTVSAHVQNWLGTTGSLQILDDELTQLTVILPGSVSEAAGTLLQQALVTLPGLLTTNLVVTLTSSDPLRVSVPPSLTILAGQFSNRFDLTVTDDALATGPQQVMITAQASGWSAGESSLTVVDDEFPPQPFLPAPVHLSSNNPVTVNLSWRAGDGELLVNGGFETGDLTPWTRNSPPGSGFIINDGLLDPSGPDGPLPPFAGGFGVLTIQTGPGTHELSQAVSLPGGGATLNWAHRVRNHGGTFASNQNFRVEIREGASVVAVPFSTQPGDALLQDWTEHSFDLTPFAGRSIDVVFIEHDELGFFNAHVDAVSLLAASPQATTYDVYFGTNATLGPANLLGSTTNLMWDLPDLAPLTTYYWQIVVRRLGTTIGPVWQFTTRGVDRFVWEPIASPQEVNVAFPATIVASDEFGTPVTNFSGAVFLAGVSQGTTNPVTPSVISNFVNGQWSGAITVAEPLANLVLLAEDAEGHSGSSAPINVTAVNDLSIGAVANPNPVMSQRPLALTVAAHNSGPATANSVVVSNWLPANFTFISATASQGSCSNAAGTVVCDLGSLIGSQTVTMTINVTATGVGLATNLTSITRAEADGVLSNNSAQQVTTILPFVTLSLTQLSANENAGVFGLLCQLSQPSTGPISFDFHAESGTAVAGLDFPATNGTLTIPAGTTSQFFFPGILDDTFDETNETFVLVLTNVVNAMPQLTRYTLTIVDDDAPPSVSIGDASAAEGNTGTSEARFPVQLSAISGVNVTVNYNSTAGTAVAGSDFIATNGTLNIPAGTTNAEIVISVRGDLLDENNETFNVNLFGPTNATLFDSLGAGTIIDDDAPPSLRVLDANFVEGQANSTQFVTVELSAASGLSIIVGYSTSNGTAIAGSDFTAAAATLGFSPGTLSRTIPITVLGDTNDEGRERFSLVLSNAIGAVIADGVGLITLFNDDAPAGTVDSFAWNVISSPQYLNVPFPVTITARDFFGNPATNFTGPVSITAIAQQPVAIVPTTSGTFVDGVWSGNMSVMQPVADVRLLASASVDQTGESNPFEVLATNDLSLSMSAAPNPVTVSDTLRFAIRMTNSGPDFASDLVLSNTLPAGAQFVSVVTSSGTCSNSADLVVCNLGWLATQTNITVEIVVSPQGAGLMTNIAAVYRAEADAYYPNNIATVVAEVLPAPSITISNVVVLEPDTTSTNARFRIFLSHPSSRDVSMEFATVPLSAGLADFVPGTGVLTIVAGTTSAIVDVTVLGDLLDETNETFALELSHPTNAVLASTTGYANIQDQDLAPLISIDDVAVAEGNPPETPSAVLTISLSRPSGLPVSLRAATQNSTAVAGLDYAATNTAVYLPPGVTNATFTVSVLPDFLDENDENIFVNLFNPTNATLADVRGVATLIDDDSSPAILVSDSSVIEGNSGSTTGIVRVALSHASGRSVSVQFAMQDGTAAGLTDYSPGVGTLVFAPGTTNLSFSIQVFGDLVVEETENFFVNFFNLTNSTMPDPSIVISIVNDDGLPGALDSFSWAAMNSPRRANTPFSATAFARDRFGDVATSFTGTATLRARAAQPEVEIGSGAVAWHYPLASFFHDSRCQVIYLASELQRAQRIAGLALNVTAPPGQALNNWTIRMKHTTRSNYLGVGFWESGGWTTVSRRPQVIGQAGWVNFPFTNVFDYNGSNHLMIDFSFDNSFYTFDGSCLSTLTSQPRAMTFRSDSANGDPVTWSSSPVPIVSSRVPNVRIQPVTTSLPVTPATIGFSSGMWTGNVTVQVPGTNVQLIAEDSFGRIGISAGFAVLPANTPINLRITRSESLVQLSWDSIAGQSYRVDFTETLDNLSWEPLAGAAVAVGPISMASDALEPGAQRFYRVVELP